MVTRPDLPDSSLIPEPSAQGPWPAWIYLALVAIVAALFWGGGNWWMERQQRMHETRPFLQVTNRDFSLFLWDFPEYMRSSVSGKAGYLPGFQYERSIAIEAGKAEEYVQAPPKVLFLYHTWKRLLGETFPKRAIKSGEFRQFLSYLPEWQPENWPGGPASYGELVASLSSDKERELPLNAIPSNVQRAFMGWKNFVLEGDAINQVKPTYEEMAAFLKLYPGYSRWLWRNIVGKSKPEYLISMNSEKTDRKKEIPENELTSFLKVGFYNYKKSTL